MFLLVAIPQFVGARSEGGKRSLGRVGVIACARALMDSQPIPPPECD